MSTGSGNLCCWIASIRSPAQILLDVAGGTGDIAKGFLRRAAARPSRGRAEASTLICDINHAMMMAGRDDDDFAWAGSLTHVCGNAEALPLPDRSVDRYVIGFGIRNVTHRARALAEARRVLKTGGRFFCLEFSHPVTDGFEAVYQRYSETIIPRLGRLIADDEDSYRYLVESIRRFPPQETFAQEIREAGFSRVRYENLSGGIVALHTGWAY